MTRSTQSKPPMDTCFYARESLFENKSGDANEKKTKNEHQGKIMLLCLVAGFFGAKCLGGRRTKRPGRQPCAARKLDGQVTPDQPGPPPFDEMMTFAEGGGAVVESNNLFPAAGAAPGHGSWESDGRTTFAFTFIKFLFDQTRTSPRER